MTPITFTAEVIKCEVKKTVSNDKMVRVIIETDDITALELQQFINESVVRMEVRGE